MSNVDMDIFEMRRKRLLELINTDFDGNQAAFSRHTGLTAPQINRWISPTSNDKRNITERSAREIEKKCGKPFDWLDTDDSKIRENSLISIFRKLSAYDQETIMLQAVALAERSSLTEQMQQAEPYERKAQ
jgi:hypothetical protein